MPYVSSDGNWGGDDPIIFDASELTMEQWKNLSDLGDYDRFDYVFAIMNNDDEDVRDIEDSYGMEHTV